MEHATGRCYNIVMVRLHTSVTTQPAPFVFLRLGVPALMVRGSAEGGSQQTLKTWYGTRYQSGSFSLINVGVAFTACVVFRFHGTVSVPLYAGPGSKSFYLGNPE